MKWYRKAAEQGDAHAQNNLGAIYNNGQGVARNYFEAVKWYRLSADQGNAGAQFNLGIVYSEGNGVSRDYAEAAKWFRKAAEQGVVVAQNNLGEIYRTGQGVPQDFAEAAKWFRKAADQGDAAAEKNLTALANFLATPAAATLARSSSAISLSGADLPKIVSTYRENGMRFKRDFFGRQFSDVLPFRGATENMFFKGTYTVGFGTGSFLSDLDCTVTSPAEISIIADWHKGDQIRIEGIVNDVAMGSVKLDPCSLSKPPAPPLESILQEPPLPLSTYPTASASQRSLDELQDMSQDIEDESNPEAYGKASCFLT